MIRLAAPGDAPAVAAIYAPIVSGTAISFEAVPPAADEMAARMASALACAPWLVCERDGAVAGFAYASRHRDRAAYQWCVDVSVYVDERRRRSGIGRALYTSLFALLRVQGFYAAHAGITMMNHESIAMHEALGFRRVAVFPGVGYKRGAWHDVGWWQLTLRERDADPRPPLPTAEAQAKPGWAPAMASGEAALER